MDKTNRVFLIWSLIWLVFVTIFVAISMQGWIITATALAVPGFVVLWSGFCRSLDLAKHRD